MTPKSKALQKKKDMAGRMISAKERRERGLGYGTISDIAGPENYVKNRKKESSRQKKGDLKNYFLSLRNQ